MRAIGLIGLWLAGISGALILVGTVLGALAMFACDVGGSWRRREWGWALFGTVLLLGCVGAMLMVAAVVVAEVWPC